MTQAIAGLRFRRLSNAMWIVAFGSFGFTDGRRWITGVLFMFALTLGWVVDRIEHRTV